MTTDTSTWWRGSVTDGVNEHVGVGTIQFKEGTCKICVDKKGTMEDFNFDFVAKNMKKSVVKSKGFYTNYIRSLANELSIKGYDAIPNVTNKLKSIMGDKRQGIHDLTRQWLSWLNHIEMFKNVKMATPEEKIDGNENMDKQ